MERAIAIAPQRNFMVSQEDIDRAVPNCPSKCALGNALTRTYPNATFVRVAMTKDGTLSWSEGNKRFVYTGLPTKAIVATYVVDEGKKETLKPMRIQLGNGLVYPAGLRGRSRYAGGKRRGKRKNPRVDKGLPQCRTMRREQLNSVLKAVSQE